MRVFPKDAWFGLTRKRLRRLALAFVCGFVLIVALYLVARTYLYFKARQAADLLQRVYAIRIGAPESSLAPLLNKYEDREHERIFKLNNARIVSASPWHLYTPFSRREWIERAFRAVLFESVPDARRRLGLRVWNVGAGIDLEDGKVSNVSVDVTVEGENEWLMGTSDLLPSLSKEALHGRDVDIEHYPEMAHYYAHWSHLHMGMETGEVLVNDLAADANAEQMQAGREFNLRCLTSFRGCHSLCELMPLATSYRHAHGYPGLGWNSGSWARQDQSCE